jgi:GNAT superfamily N-acetyltransferase
MIIRLAMPADALAVAWVHVRSWQSAYRSLLPAEYLDSLRPEDRAAHYDFSHIDPQKPRTLVVEIDGVLCGFATTMQSRDAGLPDNGELAALYVEPAHWDRGLGVALMQAARAQMVELGFRQALLWLLKGNDRAGRFYRLDGWAPDGAHRSDCVWGIDVEEFRYRRALA